MEESRTCGQSGRVWPRIKTFDFEDNATRFSDTASGLRPAAGPHHVAHHAPNTRSRRSHEQEWSRHANPCRIAPTMSIPTQERTSFAIACRLREEVKFCRRRFVVRRVRLAYHWGK